MKKLLFGLLGAVLLFSCSKDDKEGATTAASLIKGEISYDFDGAATKGVGGGYNFSDTAYFFKHESGQSQLSLNFNDTKAGTLAVGTHTFEKGKSYLSYYPGSTSERYVSTSGQVTINKIEGSLVSGTFSGSLVRQSDSKKIEITNGQFQQIAAPRI